MQTLEAGGWSVLPKDSTTVCTYRGQPSHYRASYALYEPWEHRQFRSRCKLLTWIRHFGHSLQVVGDGIFFVPLSVLFTLEANLAYHHLAWSECYCSSCEKFFCILVSCENRYTWDFLSLRRLLQTLEPLSVCYEMQTFFFFFFLHVFRHFSQKSRSLTNHEASPWPLVLINMNMKTKSLQ